MDLLALGLLWTVVVVPVGVSSAVRRRRDSITMFERARESLQPGGRPGVTLAVRRNQRRRRAIVTVLVALAVAAGIVAALSRTRVTLGLGVLAVDLCIAYAAAIAAVDRRELFSR